MRRILLTAAAACCLPLTAQADFSYSWFEVGYIADAEQESAGNSHNGDGADARINFLAGDYFYITGHIDEIELENNVDVDRFGLGFGIHNDPAAAVGLFATVTYEDIETPLHNDNGLGGTLGIRYQWKEDVEVYGGYNYARYEDLKGTFVNIGGVWAFSQAYAVVGEYSNGEFEDDATGDTADRDDLRVALRVQF